jgi:hypothetical protein
MLKVKILVFLVLLTVGSGCTPESLEGFDETANNSTNNTTTGGTFTPQFVEIAGILTTNCTQAACHGSFSSNAFTVPTDQNATPSEVRAALQNVNATSGKPLILASNPDGSEMWIRMTLETSDALYMPSTKVVLSQAEYDAIQTWIVAGAVYTQ